MKSERGFSFAMASQPFEFVWILPFPAQYVCLQSESSPTLCKKSFAPGNYFQVHHFLLHLLENWAYITLAQLHTQEIQVTSTNCELDAAFLQMLKTLKSRLSIPKVPTPPMCNMQKQD